MSPDWTAAPGRLAVITNDYPPKPGGIQQYLGNLVDAYPSDVCVLAPDDGPASATGRGESIVSRHPSRFMWPTPPVADWIEHHLAEFRPDAVLFGAPHPLPALAQRLRRRFQVPIGVLCHGAEVTIPAALPLVRTALGRALARCDVRFAVSRYTAQRVATVSGRDVRFLGAGVDVARFGPVIERNRRPLVIGCVSRFVPRKGQRLLIDAVSRLRDDGVDCELMLVGKGRLEGALRRRAISCDVPVRFAVDVPWEDLPGCYAEMDVFCMPCRTRWGGLEIEGLGLVFLEAAASGLPVLAGNSGGAPETVVPGTTGYVVQSVSDIVQAVELLIAEPDAVRTMGVRGRARVQEEFTWERVVERLLEGFAATAPPC